MNEKRTTAHIIPYISKEGSFFFFLQSSIKIGEGDYGKFFSEDEIKNESSLSKNNKKILSDLIKHI